MTTENLMEAWRSKVKNIFKEAEEFEPAAGNADDVEAPEGDVGVPADGNATPAADGNVAGNALPVDDESQSKEPITLTKGLLVQLLDAAVQSAKGGELPALGNDAVGNVEGNAEVSVDVPTEPLAADGNAESEKEKAPFGEGHKKKGDAFLAKFKKDGKDKKGEKKVEETKDEGKEDKEVVKEDDDNGVNPNLAVVPAAGNAPVGNALGNATAAIGNDLGNAVADDLAAGNADDVAGAFDVSAVVNKVFELFAAKAGAPLDVDALEQIKAAGSGVPVEGGAEGNADFSAAGNADGNSLGNAPAVGNVPTIGNPPVGNAVGNGVEESKLPAKKKLNFT
jgi:hypothetical protein